MNANSTHWLPNLLSIFPLTITWYPHAVAVE
jgi:hypothetical protein